MRIAWTARAWADYLRWLEEDASVHARINALIKETARSPFAGIGKPEPLRGELAGYWSRRIDREHRLVYFVKGKGDDQSLEIVACRFHYGER